MDIRRLSEAIVRLVNLAARLRGPGGCPWDAKQTYDTVKNYLLEEAYEVVDAVERHDPQLVCGELGDLLFQIVFMAQLATERGEFDLTDVIEEIEEKMIRRHPHVFGHVRVKDAEEVAENWAKIKETEKGAVGAKGPSGLREVPIALPALLRCHRLCERASKMKFEIGRLEDLPRLVEEGTRLVRNVGGKEISEESAKILGWSLFAFAEIVRQKGGNAEDLVRKTNERFVEAVEALAKVLEEDGIEMEEADESQLRKAWEKVRERI